MVYVVAWLPGVLHPDSEVKESFTVDKCRGKAKEFIVINFQWLKKKVLHKCNTPEWAVVHVRLFHASYLTHTIEHTTILNSNNQT